VGLSLVIKNKDAESFERVPGPYYPPHPEGRTWSSFARDAQHFVPHNVGSWGSTTDRLDDEAFDSALRRIRRGPWTEAALQQQCRLLGYSRPGAQGGHRAERVGEANHPGPKSSLGTATQFRPTQRSRKQPVCAKPVAAKTLRGFKPIQRRSGQGIGSRTQSAAALARTRGSLKLVLNPAGIRICVMPGTAH